jgi:YHS domain-containing protein
MPEQMPISPDSVHLVTVCHRNINGNPAYYPQEEYDGQTFYFCTEACLHAFQDNPEKFIKVHGQEEK